MGKIINFVNVVNNKNNTPIHLISQKRTSKGIAYERQIQQDERNFEILKNRKRHLKIKGYITIAALSIGIGTTTFFASKTNTSNLRKDISISTEANEEILSKDIVMEQAENLIKKKLSSTWECKNLEDISITYNYIDKNSGDGKQIWITNNNNFLVYTNSFFADNPNINKDFEKLLKSTISMHFDSSPSKKSLSKFNTSTKTLKLSLKDVSSIIEKEDIKNHDNYK